MKHILNIKRDDVWHDVETHAAYQAAKNSADYNHDRMKRSDKEIFDMYFKEATNQLPQLFLAYMDGQYLNEHEYVILLHIEDFPKALSPSIDMAAHLMVVYYILTRWLTMLSSGNETTQGAAEESTKLCDSQRDIIRRTLMRRTRPYKLKSHPF